MSAPSRTATLARLAVAAAGLALLVTLAVAPMLGPSGARAGAPLPDCRYDDILTTPRGYGDWSMTLVDTILRVPKGYVPPDLVKASQAGIPGGGQVRAVMIDDLRAMTDAAALADAAIGVQSAYRSFESQKTVFAGWVARLGYSQALKVSARPGHSEHQLGLAIDFRSEPGGSSLTGAFATTPAGKWMKAHAWEYGFVMSYPRRSIAVTCYDFEPWHFRYVGRDLAALIHGSGLTPREYLWANFTTTIVPPAPTPTKAPAKTAKPTATPDPSPTLAPSPSPAPTTAPPTATPVPPTAAPLPPTAEPTPAPLATPAPGDGDIGAVAPVVVGGAVGVLGLIAVGAWLALRRGRSGVGLSG